MLFLRAHMYVGRVLLGGLFGRKLRKIKDGGGPLHTIFRDEAPWNFTGVFMHSVMCFGLVRPSRKMYSALFRGSSDKTLQVLSSAVSPNVTSDARNDAYGRRRLGLAGKTLKVAFLFSNSEVRSVACALVILFLSLSRGFAF